MSAFHFLRPEYLLLLLPAWGLVWWLLRTQNDEKKWQKIIEPKLLKHLLVEPKSHTARIAAPWQLGAVLTLMILAVSGPAWKLKASPFTEDTTKIALLVSVKESMLTTDILPTRLGRSVIKIEDLLAQKADRKAALIAYSGTAHLVLPVTGDHTIIKTFAQALDPTIMPLEGDNVQDALVLAQKELEQKGATIIVLTDSILPSNAKLALKQGYTNDMHVILWQMASKELSSRSDFENAASILDAEVVTYSRDDSDVKKISSMIESNFKDAQKADSDKYEDGGYWLVPLIFLLMLGWARQGFIAELWRRA